MDVLTSKVIYFLRFPLIVAVVFIHCDLTVSNPELEERPLFFILMTIVLNLVSVAVPLFFFISGLLFFKNGLFTFSLYIRKIHSRIYTILLPYFLWNIIYFLLIAFIQLINSNFLFILHKRIADFCWQDYIWLFWDISKITHLSEDQHSCLVGAFWFLQNLIVMFIFSPFIYYIIKFFRHFTLILLLILYFSKIIPNITGISIESIFWFSLGAYCSILNINFISLIKNKKILIGLLFFTTIAIIIDNTYEYTIFTLFKYYIFFTI